MQNLKRILFICCFLLSNYLISGACDDYELGHLEVTIKEGAGEGLKIMATAHEAVPYNTVSRRIIAEEMAQELATSELAKFWLQDVARACATDRTFNENVKFSSDDPENVEVNSEEIINRVCALASGTAGTTFLRGTTKVDSCIQVSEAPRMVKVTIGISDEQIKIAEKGARLVGESIARTSTPQNDNPVMHPECITDPSSEKCEKEDSEEESADSKGMPLNKDKDKKGGEKAKKF